MTNETMAKLVRNHQENLHLATKSEEELANEKDTPENIKLYRAKDEQDIWHWWCVDVNGKLIDLTEDQYYKRDRIPPYDKGEKASMLGWGYRKRVINLLEKVKKELDMFGYTFNGPVDERPFVFLDKNKKYDIF